MICAQCGAANADGARFCGGCGSAASMTFPSVADVGPADPTSLIGREIAGRFRILAKIGEGGMGAVYRAEQISLKRTVALKLLRPEVAASPLLVRRFNAEAEAVAKLSHPNTVGIYDFGQDTDGTLFISMELIAGASLRSVVHAEAPLGIGRSLAILSQICASLIDAHAHGLVHRDLKPDNVMLQERGRQRDIARVLDFGIAKLRDDSRQSQLAMTQAGDMLGTPQYMAPEQIKGEAIDGRTDIYALGCILYEMVTARLPFEGPTVMSLLSKHLLDAPMPPSQRRPDLGIPKAIDDLVLSAMAKLPIARPQTMELYSEQIAQVAAMFPPAPGAGTAPLSSAQPVGIPVPTPIAPSAGAHYLAPPPSQAPQFQQSQPAFPQSQPGFQQSQPAFQGSHGSPSAPVVSAPPGSNATIWIMLAAGLVAGGIALALVLNRNVAQTPRPSVVQPGPAPVVDPLARTGALDAPGRHEPPPEAPDSSDESGDDATDFGGFGLGGASGNPFGASPPGVELKDVDGFERREWLGMKAIVKADESAVVAVMGVLSQDLASQAPADAAIIVRSHGGMRSGVAIVTPVNGKAQRIVMLVFEGRGYSTTVMVMTSPQEILTPAQLGAVLDEVLVLPDDGA